MHRKLTSRHKPAQLPASMAAFLLRNSPPVPPSLLRHWNTPLPLRRHEQVSIVPANKLTRAVREELGSASLKVPPRQATFLPQCKAPKHLATRYRYVLCTLLRPLRSRVPLHTLRVRPRVNLTPRSTIQNLTTTPPFSKQRWQQPRLLDNRLSSPSYRLVRPRLSRPQQQTTRVHTVVSRQSTPPRVTVLLSNPPLQQTNAGDSRLSSVTRHRALNSAALVGEVRHTCSRSLPVLACCILVRVDGNS